MPKLRFARFNNDEFWKKSSLNELSIINPKSLPLEDKFIYIDLDSIHQGTLKNKKIISKIEAPSRAQRVLKNKDILFSCVRPYQQNNFLTFIDESYQFVASTGFAQIRSFIDTYFLYYVLHTNHFLNRVMVYCTGSNYPAINVKNLAKINIYYPVLHDEQYMIGHLFKLLDEKKNIMSLKIGALKLYKKGLQQKIFFNNCIDKTFPHKLGEFLEHYVQYNEDSLFKPVAVGKYGLKLREEIYSKDLSTDYSKNKVIKKDTLIIGMGSSQIDIGILEDNTNYCVSPAYTTYKILNINSKYLKNYLEIINSIISAKYMIKSARQGKSVDKTGLLNYKLQIADNNSQNIISKLFESIDNLISNLSKIVYYLSSYKNQILKDIFI